MATIAQFAFRILTQCVIVSHWKGEHLAHIVFRANRSRTEMQILCRIGHTITLIVEDVLLSHKGKQSGEYRDQNQNRDDDRQQDGDIVEWSGGGVLRGGDVRVGQLHEHCGRIPSGKVENGLRHSWNGRAEGEREREWPESAIRLILFASTLNAFITGSGSGNY